MSGAADRAYLTIRSSILDGSLEPGRRLKEEELAARIGVSRTPVREALRRLLNDGMAERVAGASTISVAEFSTADIEDSFRLRGLLEAHAVSLACGRMRREQLARLQTLVDEMERLVNSGNKPKRYLDLNSEFHRVILEASGSRRLAQLMPFVVELLIVVRTFHAYDQAALQRSNFQHREVVAALQMQDADWAAAVMRSHITNAWHSWNRRQPPVRTEAAD